MASGSRRTIFLAITWILLITQIHTSLLRANRQGNEIAADVVVTKRDTEWRRLQPSRPTGKELDSAVLFARGVVSRLARLESNLNGARLNVKLGSPAHGQLIDSYPRNQSLDHGKEALIAVKASLYLQHNHCRRFGLDKEHCAKLIAKLPMNTTSLGKTCAPTGGDLTYCSQSKYRSYDGSCNSQEFGNAGQALTAYRRLLPPQYGDGIQMPRENTRGKPLPSARLVSTQLARDSNRMEEDKTLTLMQWSQFVEHDMSHTPVSKMINSKSSILCCQDGRALAPRHLHPACLPVNVPGDDPVYARERVTCLNYVRSLPALRRDCTFGPREQMNQASHFLDGSMLYGSTAQQAASLRQYHAGRLQDTRKDGRSFLPSSEHPASECQISADSTTCYKSGDIRVNGHPHLTVMYTLWHREHNRLAGHLMRLNPHWDDEKLYQEARRIVIAEIQHITYNEWLPVVLGEKVMNKIGISLNKSGSTMKYDSFVEPSVSNSFSTGALRFVHSMMASRLHLYEEDRSSNRSVLLRDHFHRPRVVEEPGHLDAFTRGLATQGSQKSDMDYITDMTSRLYQDSNPYGLDMISLDIQRGRDHGLPGYNSYRKLCGLPEATTFEQFHDVIPKQIVSKLRVYNHPSDVDLLIGGMSEEPSSGSLLGPTFRCIVGEQFARTMRGDRYFYDRRNQPYSFTQEQLKALKQVTLARIFCDNGDEIVSMQPDVFRKPSSSNNLVKCRNSSSIPTLDLTQWKENKVFA